MNIGPQPNGELPALALDRLKGMGEWMNKYGETIYGTTRGGVESPEWGTTTRKGNMLYVHILADKMPSFITLPLKERVKKAVLFDGGEKVKAERIDGGVVLHTADLKPDTDCIVALTLAD